MRRQWLFGLLWFWPLAAAALPHLELDVRLDPDTRRFEARAVLTDNAGIDAFRLGRGFEIATLAADGQRLRPARRPAGVDFYGFSLPPGTRRVEVSYRAKLEPTPRLDHRQVLGHRTASAGPEGSFLPAGAGWYPETGRMFSYRIALAVPPDQKGIATGSFVAESETASGYRAEFAFPWATDGIDLMAGPYEVGERLLRLGERTIRVRTWFHPELRELAPGYLEDAARTIERYSRLIGPYPFESFGIVSSPTPTGFGMPGLTYLGREVLRLPFIRATSLGHEVLHNWWGNGVYPDWQSGNWSEGLTTFLADYAFKEDQGEAAAREMRLGWLRDYAAVPPEEDFALKDFTARRHGISSVIGYGKAAMVFLMLRDQIGTAAFERGLRLLWERKRFQTASWRDLETAFSEAAGRPLGEFFSRWVDQAGAPAFSGSDPDYRIWRRLDPKELPPILRETFIAPSARLVVADADRRIAAAAQALAERVLDARGGQGRAPAWLIVGTPAAVDAWLARHGLPPRPREAAGGSAQVWAGRDGAGRGYAVVSAADADALRALVRPLPHYGRQSWLVFEGSRAIGRGVFPMPPVQGAVPPASTLQ